MIPFPCSHTQGRHHLLSPSFPMSMERAYTSAFPNWNLQGDKNIFFYTGPYFFNVLYNTSLISHMLEIFLELNDTLGTKIFFNFSKFLETLKVPMFYRCHLTFSFLAGSFLILFLIHIYRSSLKQI